MAKKIIKDKSIKRRNFLKGAGAAALGAAAVSSLPAPAISGGHKEWIVCCAFGKAGLLGQAIAAYADNINKYSDKEIEIPESDAINQIKKLIKLDD